MGRDGPQALVKAVMLGVLALGADSAAAALAPGHHQHVAFALHCPRVALCTTMAMAGEKAGAAVWRPSLRASGRVHEPFPRWPRSMPSGSRQVGASWTSGFEPIARRCSGSLRMNGEQDNVGRKDRQQENRRDSPRHAAVPWLARAESRRITANLIEMLKCEPGRARAYFDALCLEGKADSFHYSVMMDASPDVGGAQALLDQMRREGVTPQTTSMNVLLKKMCLVGDMAAAEVLLQEMLESDVPPDERSYTQLIYGYSEQGNGHHAERLFGLMQEKGFAQHVPCWEDLVTNLKLKVNTATLANMLSKGPDHRPQAQRFYQGLVASNTTDIVLFNIMLNATRTVVEARGVWNDMQSAHLQPSTTSYNTLLRVLCENECIDEAMHVLQQAEAAALADERTYTRIINHLHHCGKVKEATELFDRSQERLSKAPAKDAGALFGSSDDAMTRGSVPTQGDSHRRGASGGEQPTSEPPYMALVRRVASSERTKELDRMLKAGRLDEAWVLFRCWASRGEADTYSYNTIMHGCGSASQALALKANMTANSIALSHSTWNILVQLLSMEGRISEGQALLEEMEASGITPTERTLRPLLKAMRACGRARDARRLAQRCKLERRVKEKEELARRASEGFRTDQDHGISEGERKDAAAAAVARAIAGRHLRRQNMDDRNATAELQPPPGGWEQFQESSGRKVGSKERTGRSKGQDRGGGGPAPRGATDTSWRS